MPTISYKIDLLKRLESHRYAAKYLKAAFDETLHDGDMDAFLLALRNVVEASGNISAVANQSGITRQHLHKLLSGKGNPTLDTLTSVLKSVGISLSFEPYGK